jgi:hypothetical protein
MGPLFGIASLAAVSALAVLLRVRDYAFAWGASADELRQSWPGDELCPESASIATRSIAIDAPAKVVWGYVAQLGQDRAGFYSYRWLENLFGCDMPKVDRLVPEWQERSFGENVWLARRDRYHGTAHLKIARLDEGRDLVLTSPEDFGRVLRHESASGGAWTFIVTPRGCEACTLVVRSRGPEYAGLLAGLLRSLVFDPAHFIMERKMMRRIKILAEQEGRGPCSCETSCRGRSSRSGRRRPRLVRGPS